MEQYPVYYRAAALEHLQEIFTFIAERSQSPSVAEGFVQRIMNRCEAIGAAPKSGVARTEFGDGLRMVPFERSAAIFCRIHRKRVEIVAIVYGGRDYDVLFRSDN